LNNSVFSFLLNVAKDLGFFSEFQIFGAAWMNALDDNLVCAAHDSKRLKEEECSGWIGL